jgi:hypothetical protein
VNKKYYFVLLLVLIISFFIYWLSSVGNTPYDYFTRLAQSFLRGRYWLTENPEWLNELIPAGLNRYYVVHPPMPAIILIPLVFLFGSNFPQQYLAHFLGATTVVSTMMLSWKIKQNWLLSLWSGLFIGFGSIIWFLSSVGSSWYLGQISAAFFLTSALAEGLGQKRPALMGLLLGAAYWSRVDAILSAPLFFYIIWQKKEGLKPFFFFGLTLSLFLLFNAIYNFVRFGVFWDIGYTLIPGVLKEPWFSKGIMSPQYIWGNLKVVFLAMPRIFISFPYLKPSWGGLAIWLTTPAFIFSLWADFKDRLTKFLWLSVLSIFSFVLMHGAPGFSQFGYRYGVDFYPFLTLLTIKGAARTGLKWYHWLLLVIGIIVNLWGVLWINKFGWVSF